MLFKKWALFVSGILMCFVADVHAASSTFQDVQNFNHGYCPTCNCYPCKCQAAAPLGPPPAAAPVPAPCGTPPSPAPGPCNPCAPVCGAECGLSFSAVAVVVAAVAIGVVIIILSGPGSNR